MEVFKIDGLTDLSYEEMIETEGGIAPIVVAAAVVGAGVGVIIIGAAVGYGIYKLIDWATS
jgi:lactobin A/cerein 7B family class IIb bacteriocin